MAALIISEVSRGQRGWVAAGSVSVSENAGGNYDAKFVSSVGSIVSGSPTMQKFQDSVLSSVPHYPFGLARLGKKNHLDCYSSAR
jgi:hypothetical protein